MQENVYREVGVDSRKFRRCFSLSLLLLASLISGPKAAHALFTPDIMIGYSQIVGTSFGHMDGRNTHQPATGETVYLKRPTSGSGLALQLGFLEPDRYGWGIEMNLEYMTFQGRHADVPNSKPAMNTFTFNYGFRMLERVEPQIELGIGGGASSTDMFISDGVRDATGELENLDLNGRGVYGQGSLTYLAGNGFRMALSVWWRTTRFNKASYTDWYQGDFYSEDLDLPPVWQHFLLFRLSLEGQF